MAPVVASNIPCNQGKMSEIRRTSKHIMERKRRARINDSLLQLKGLVFPAIKKEGNGQPKMEKADILEMTVKYLQQQRVSGCQQLPNDGSQFRAGFSECVGEISKCLGACEEIDLDVKMRIMGHLSNKFSSNVQQCSPSLPPSPPPQAAYIPTSPVHSISPAYRGQSECTVLPPQVSCYPVGAVFITPPSSPVRSTMSPINGLTSVNVVQPSFAKQQIVGNEPVWRPW